jgi:hypothetical protein
VAKKLSCSALVQDTRDSAVSEALSWYGRSCQDMVASNTSESHLSNNSSVHES